VKFDTASFVLAFPVLLGGLLTTIWLTLASTAIGSLAGLIGCIGQLQGRGALNWLARFYVGTFRGLPETVLIFWIYFCVPFVFEVRLSAFTCAVIALSSVAGAYLTEIFRAGILAVPRGQTAAARALGLSMPAMAIYIVVPQAFRIMLPALLGLITIIIKNSGIASAIGVAELFYKGQIIAADNFKHFEVFTAVGVLYFLIIFPLSMSSRFLEKRLAVSNQKS
jgi:His/Glu/Gln/Arg/opine family amino acid ABC transporter permease subunit